MIIIVTDLNRLRGFQVVPNEHDPLNPQPMLKELDLPPMSDVPQKLKDAVTDQAGRFRSDGNPGMANGEALGLQREQENRNIARVARSLEALLQRKGATKWALAAPKTINAKLVERLEPSARQNIMENVQADLCKQPVLEIQKRFNLPSTESL